jgi:superfamily I DNA/RNA helicase
LAKQAGVLPAKEEYDQQFFDQELPRALMEASDALDVHYDAIVVDEGQDFQDGWWLPLQMLLRDPDDGILYIFFDDNQRIYVHHGQFPISGSPFLLTVNCRNTQNIHNVVVQFYEAETRPTALGPPGRPVEEAAYSDSQHLWPTLQGTLRRLTEEEQVPAEEITVLTPLVRIKDSLLSSSLASGPKLTDSLPARQGQVYCTTIHSFKGLERSVIILVGVGQKLSQEDHDLNSLLYVGCSRARHHLIVLMPENTDQRVKKAFAAAGAG